MDLTPAELKFLLTLLGYPSYRTAIAQIKLSPQTKAEERDRICRRLGEQGLVDYTSEVVKFAIAPAGRTLIGLDTTSLPVTPSELWILRSCQSGSIGPGEISRKVPASERLTLIRNLARRGLVKIRSARIKQVWLTAVGQNFLRDDCMPHGSASTISGDLLNSYLQFLRQFFEPPEKARADPKDMAKPTPAAVLQTIRQLDQTLATDNYLPIFYLREALQPLLCRAELDERLYQLQQEDQIELRPLQDVSAYGEAQLTAGIFHGIGSPLFFVSVVESVKEQS